MRRLSDDAMLALGLFIVLVFLTIFAAVQQTRQVQPPALSSSSANPDGAKALSLWAHEMGYRVISEVDDQFQIPERTDVVFMLEPFPFPPITEAEWDVLDQWVEDGGRLIIAAQGFGSVQVAEHYEFELNSTDQTIETATPLFPILLAPPQNQPVIADTRLVFETEREDIFVLLADAAGPLAVQFEQGDGDVILMSTSTPFTNAGLKEDGSGEFILNLFAGFEDGSQIWFNEWHHNVRVSRVEVRGPIAFLRYTPVGRSMLYIAAVFFVGLVLSGRHFGRPLRPQQETTRRTRGEYVTSLANLYRRSGHRRMVLGRMRAQLKRELGRRYRLDPGLADALYVQELSRINPELPIEQLMDLLAQLARPDVSEAGMVQLATQVSDWLDAKNTEIS